MKLDSQEPTPGVRLNGIDDELLSRSSAEIHLVDLLLVVAKNRRMILSSSLIAGILIAVLSLLMPNIYTGTARILPPQKGQASATALLNQLAPLVGVASPDLGMKSGSTLYVGMLKSRAVADFVIAKCQLQKHYKTQRMSDTREILAEASDISASTDGLITIEVENRDPQLAADMANGYVAGLQQLSSNLALAEASQRRIFFESQLEQAKETMAKAEAGFKAVQESTGLIEPTGQARMILQASATLRGLIAAKQVQLQSMRAFATPSNPDLIRAEEELAALRNQLGQTEQGGARGDVQVPVGKIPAASLEFVRRFRDVKYAETLFEILSKQYEAAKLDEARSFGLPQIVDEAVRPDKKSKPKRSILVLLGMLVAGVIATAAAFVKESAALEFSDPERAQRWQLVKDLSKQSPFRG